MGPSGGEPERQGGVWEREEDEERESAICRLGGLHIPVRIGVAGVTFPIQSIGKGVLKGWPRNIHDLFQPHNSSIRQNVHYQPLDHETKAQ